MSKPKATFITTLKQREWLSSDAYELRCSRPEGFTFRSGQHITLHVDGDERDYTVVSPESADQLVLLVKELEGGKVSKKLAQMDLGSQLQITGPGGYLVERPTQKQRVLVATGTGIAPFASMIANGMQAAFLLHGARTTKELYYRHLIKEAVSRYIPCVSGNVEDSGDGDSCYQGYVTRYIEEYLPDGDYDFYLCGKWDMIKDVTHVIDDRFSEAGLYSEGFY